MRSIKYSRDTLNTAIEMFPMINQIKVNRDFVIYRA